MWHIKPSKIWSYKQFRSTNIVPEEGIPQPYLDEGCGNVHGDHDGAPAPPRSDLNQSTKHSEKSHPCAEKSGRGLLGLWGGGCYPAKSGCGEGGEEAVAHEAPLCPARPRHQLPAGGEAAGTSIEAARFRRRRRLRRRHGKRDKRSLNPTKPVRPSLCNWPVGPPFG